MMHDGCVFKPSVQFFRLRKDTYYGECAIFLRECRALCSVSARKSLEISEREHPNYAIVEQVDSGLSDAV